MPNRSSAYDFESWLHRRFSSANIGGEWFDPKGCGLKRAFGVWNKITKQQVDPEKVRKSSRQRQLEIENERLRVERNGLKKKIKKLEQDIEEYLDGRFS